MIDPVPGVWLAVQASPLDVDIVVVGIKVDVPYRGSLACLWVAN
jgi:hypothetical protein